MKDKMGGAKVLDLAQIQKMLPYGQRLLFIHGVTDWSEAEARIVSFCRVSEMHCEDYCDVFPGAFLIEAICQTAILAAHLHSRIVAEGKKPTAVSAQHVKWLKVVRLGDLLRFEVHLTSVHPNSMFFSGLAFVGDEVVASVGGGHIVFTER